MALLARHANGKLAFAGGALIALPAVDRDRLWNATAPLELSRPAFRLGIATVGTEGPLSDDSPSAPNCDEDMFRNAA